MVNGYLEKQCSHGMCLKHDPKWEVLEETFEPNPTGLLGRTTTCAYLRCCDQPMQRVKEMVRERCKKCGRGRERVLNEFVALCNCCGYHFTTFPPSLLETLLRL